MPFERFFPSVWTKRFVWEIRVYACVYIYTHVEAAVIITDQTALGEDETGAFSLPFVEDWHFFGVYNKYNLYIQKYTVYACGRTKYVDEW